jgi:hypothetical protein
MLNIIAVYKRPVTGRDGERKFWGTYGKEYVQKLYNGLVRHVREPWALTLLTDTPAFRPECHNCQRQTRVVPLIGPGAGWWAKLEMFRPDVMMERNLYLDLDNVVGGDLSPITSLPFVLETDDPKIGEVVPIWMLDDLVSNRFANGSTILFTQHDALAALWDEYLRNPKGVEKEFSEWPNASDQAYIANRVRRAGFHIPYMQDYLPKGMILNSRVELEKGADWSNTALVYGSWDPKPHQSSHPYYARNWR